MKKTLSSWPRVLNIGAETFCRHIMTKREQYPAKIVRMLFRAAGIAIAIVWAGLAISMLSRTDGEIAASVILQGAFAAAFILGLLALALFILSTAYSIKNDTAPQRNLGAGNFAEPAQAIPEWVAPGIGDDILVCTMPGERIKDFALKMESAGDKVSHAIWAVIIPPFKNEAAIFTASQETDFYFPRGQEPFVEMLEPEEMLPAGMDHLEESLEVYWRYVTWFCKHYNRWSVGAKLEANKRRARTTFFETIAHGKVRAAAALTVLMLIAGTAFTQSKARQVDMALGTRIAEIPKRGDRVVYVFREGSKEKYYNRTGDGKSEYTTLLQATSGLVPYNDEGGEFLYVTKNGETVAKADGVQEVSEYVNQPKQDKNAVYLEPNNTGDPIRPRSINSESESRNTGVGGILGNLPDSTEVAEKLDGVKKDIQDSRGPLWAIVKPVWKFLIWAFSGIDVIAICFLGLCRYVAKTAANESLVNTYGRAIVGGWIVYAQQNAAAATLVLMWVIMLGLLINEFLWLVWLDYSVGIMLVIWWPSLWVAEYITGRVVPNLKMVSGSGRNITRDIQPY